MKKATQILLAALLVSQAGCAAVKTRCDMDRTTGDGYVTVGGKRQFTDGPPATTVNADHMNQVQEEIMTCIQNAGLTPSAADRTQLAQAVPKLAGMAGGAGLLWTDLTALPYGQLYGAAYNGSIYVVVGAANGGKATILTSTDLVTWTAQNNPQNVDLKDIIWHARLGLFVAVGNADGTNSYILTSPDGQVWTERSPTVAKNFGLLSLAHNNGTIVAVGEADGADAYILTSTDAVTWTEQANPKNVKLTSICWGKDLFVAVGVGDGVDKYIVTSPDGAAPWTERANGMNGGLFWGIVTYFDRSFYCAEGFGNSVFTSTDGITWVDRSTPSAKFTISPIAITNYGLGVMAYGMYNNELVTSIEGAQWLTRTAPGRQYWRFVSIGGTFMMALGPGPGSPASSWIGYAIMR